MILPLGTFPDVLVRLGSRSGTRIWFRSRSQTERSGVLCSSFFYFFLMIPSMSHTRKHKYSYSFSGSRQYRDYEEFWVKRIWVLVRLWGEKMLMQNRMDNDSFSQAGPYSEIYLRSVSQSSMRAHGWSKSRGKRDAMWLPISWAWTWSRCRSKSTA